MEKTGIITLPLAIVRGLVNPKAFWLASLPVLRFGLRSNPPSGPKIEARTITALLPDTGDRYLSTPLFAD